MEMNQAQTQPPLASDEKAAQLMIYMADGLYWGTAHVKTLIRVSTWLRTSSAPDTVTLYDAFWLPLSGGGVKPLRFPDLHLPTAHILAYHLMPPAKDPLDYDPTEPNRKMESISAMVGTFRMDGMLRISAITDLARYLTVNRELFTALYDATITNPVYPTVGAIRVPFVLVRQATTIFSNRKGG